MAPKAAAKRVGRPKKVFSSDPVEDKKLHSSHASWEFTDHKLFYQESGELDQERFSFWERLSEDDYSSKIKIAKERCPNTGRWHGQGRITMKRKYRFDSLMKILPPIHVEATVATIDWAYFVKYGTELILDVDNRRHGQRVIFADQAISIGKGATLRDCAFMEGANYQSVRSAELLLPYMEPERPVRKRELIIDRTRADQLDDPNVYRLNDPRWWDGYDGHKTLYINQEVLKLSIPLLKLYCGPTGFRVGKGRQARHDRVIIYGANRDEMKALGLNPLPNPLDRIDQQIMTRKQLLDLSARGIEF